MKASCYFSRHEENGMLAAPYSKKHGERLPRQLLEGQRFLRLAICATNERA